MARKSYGMPYKGSKNTIAKEIVDVIPPATHFFDLFAGGCAITHAALESGKWDQVHANDLDGRGLKLFCDAIDGKYHDEHRWISREEFHARKADDPYVALCWSFGNNGRSYLYGREIEGMKRIMWDMIMEPDYRDRYAAWLKLKPYLAEIAGDGAAAGVESVQRLARVQSVEALARVQSIERLARVQPVERPAGSFTAAYTDYQDAYHGETDAVLYCDIPYRGKTGGTGVYDSAAFDYDRFYSWCHAQTGLVVVSEYSMPDGFVSVWERVKAVTSAAITTGHAVEHLFVPEEQLDLWHERQEQIRMEGMTDG